MTSAERELFTVCPRCGKRAKVISHRWDWDRDQDFVTAKCGCGKFNASYDEGRVVDIDLDNPYMKQAHFKLLLPLNWDNNMWTMVGGCLMESWVEEG